MQSTSKGAKTSQRLVTSALELIQLRGYSGTGLNTILEHAAAPKGSMYFHFPGGKEELGQRAVELAADQFEALLGEPAASPAELVGQAIDVLTGLLTESEFTIGCPVSVVTLEMGATSEPLRSACAAAFDSWIALLEDRLRAGGCLPGTARTLATTVVCTIEGAVIIARAKRDVEPLHNAGLVLDNLLSQAESVHSEAEEALS